MGCDAFFADERDESGSARRAEPARRARRERGSSSAAPRAAIEIDRQGLVVPLPRIDEVIVDAEPGESAAEILAMRLGFFHIPLAGDMWIDLQLLARLEIGEKGGRREGKLQLRLVL